MLVDADPDHATIWTKPEDLEIDSADPHLGLSGNHDREFAATACDGAAGFVSSDIDTETLAALLMRNSGVFIPGFWSKR